MTEQTRKDVLCAWLQQLNLYEDKQMERLKSWQIDPKKWRVMEGIIDGRTYTKNHRVVFMITNGIGQRAYADTSTEAMSISRDAVNQPCKIKVMPIMPVGTHHDTPLDTLKKLIEDVLQNE